MEIDKPKIEKLRDTDNWQQWQFVVRTLLDSDDLLDVCDGTMEKPNENDVDFKKRMLSWNKANKAAKKLIVTTVESKPLQLLMNCETAYEMWQKLHNVYDMKSDESLSLIQKQFFEFNWDLTGNIAQHISKLEQLANKMKKLGSGVPESMLITRVLSTLPPKYNHFHSAWDSTEKSKKTLENLTTRLLTEEQRLQKQEDINESTIALLTKLKIQQNNSSKKKNYDLNKKKKLSCFTCGKKDHFRKDCPGCFVCGSKEHLQRNCPKKNNMSKQGECRSSGAFVGSIDQVSSKEDWLIDTGATDHITNRRDWFCEFRQFSEALKISIGNGDMILAIGQGNIQIETNVQGKWLPGVMYNVLYAPDIIQNLFSVKVAATKGVDFMLSNHGERCMFMRNNQIVAIGVEVGKLYKIQLRVITQNKACVASKVDTLQLWHERMGHQNKRHVKTFLKEMNIDVTVDNEFCDACAYGKHHRLSFNERTNRATETRMIIHSDVCGPMSVQSVGKKRYYVMFKDEFSSFRTVYFIREKSEVKDKLELFCSETKTFFGQCIKELRSDGGKEYVNKDVSALTGKLGIKHTVTCPYSPEQNGTAERENRILVEAARSMLHGKPELPPFLWAEAVNTAAYVLNRTGPSKIPGKTPFELWFGKNARINHLKVFGTECFVNIPKEKRKKFDKKAYKGYFVGYLDGIAGYRVWVPEIHDVIMSHDVIFKEESIIDTRIKVEETSSQEASHQPIVEEASSQETSTQPNVEETSSKLNEILSQKKVQEVSENNTNNIFAMLAEVEPMTFKEAISSDDAENWK